MAGEEEGDPAERSGRFAYSTAGLLSFSEMPDHLQFSKIERVLVPGLSLFTSKITDSIETPNGSMSRLEIVGGPVAEAPRRDFGPCRPEHQLI